MLPVPFLLLTSLIPLYFEVYLCFHGAWAPQTEPKLPSTLSLSHLFMSIFSALLSLSSLDNSFQILKISNGPRYKFLALVDFLGEEKGVMKRRCKGVKPSRNNNIQSSSPGQGPSEIQDSASLQQLINMLVQICFQLFRTAL